MALKFLTSLDVQSFIDLNENELRNAVVHTGTSDPASPTEGQIFYRLDTNELKFYNGSAWQAVGTGSGAVDSVNGQTGVVVLDTDDISEGTNKFATSTQLAKVDFISISQAVNLDTLESNVSTNNAKVSNVTTNLSASADGDSLTVSSSDGTDASIPAATTSAWGAMTDEDKSKLDGIEASADVTDATNVTSALGSISVTAHSDVSSVGSGSIITTAERNKLSGIEASADVTDTANVKSALNANLGNTTFGDSDDTITIAGNLIVSGTQTIQNETIQIIENNTISFEGTTANDFETSLTAIDPTADRTISLPNLTGHVALFSAESTATISATPSELNKLDGVTASTSELNKLDGVTATTSEINILDGVTANATEINLLDGLTTLSGSNTGDEADASTSVKGVVELATNTETNTGTDSVRATTPAGVKSAIDARTFVGTCSTGSSSFTITHNLGTRDVIVQLYENASPYNTIFADVERDDTNNVGVNFASNLTTAVKVLVTKVV